MFVKLKTKQQIILINIHQIASMKQVSIDPETTQIVMDSTDLFITNESAEEFVRRCLDMLSPEGSKYFDQVD
jgi:hypothetical protein